MSNLGPLSNQAASRVPTPPRGETIARYDTYLEAQRAVDYLSDQHFPVQFVTIVGSGLRMVERITGRLSYPRVAGAGAASGAWFGLFVGLVLTMFSTGSDLSVAAIALVGAGFGMLFGVISYAFTRGKRDFTSTSQIVASEYEVLCMPEQAQAARELLIRLPGGRGRTEDRQQPAPGWPGAAKTGGPGDGWPTSGVAGAGAVPDPSTMPPPTGRPLPGPPPEEPATPVGPTYGEMIERQRQEQRAREAAAREAAEREAAEREAAEREAAERRAREQEVTAREAAEREAAERGTAEPGTAEDQGAESARGTDDRRQDAG